MTAGARRTAVVLLFGRRRSPKCTSRLFVPSRSEVKREDPKVKGGLSRRTSPTRGKGKNNTTQCVLDVIIFVPVL